VAFFNRAPFVISDSKASCTSTVSDKFNIALGHSLSFFLILAQRSCNLPDLLRLLSGGPQGASFQAKAAGVVVPQHLAKEAAAVEGVEDQAYCVQVVIWRVSLIYAVRGKGRLLWFSGEVGQRTTRARCSGQSRSLDPNRCARK
jgi:hypothetical protein